MTRSLLDAPIPRRGSYGPAVFTVGAHGLLVVTIAAVVVEPSLIEPSLIERGVVLADFIDIEVPQEPLVPPPLVPPPPLAAAKPESIRPQLPSAPVPAGKPIDASPEPPPTPPPAAAEAASVLAAEDVVDLRNSFVIGSRAKFAGGVTDSTGASARVASAAGAAGAGGGVTPNGGPVGQSAADGRARVPRLAGGASWSCPFPPEADVAGINRAVVSLRVSVGAAGGVTGVQVTTDPGYGFGRAARRCAMHKRWEPGLDAAGRVVEATAVVNVRFVR